MNASDPPSSRSHTLLAWLIRGTGASIAAAAAITGGYVILAFLFAAGRAYPLDFFATAIVVLAVAYFCRIFRNKLYLALAFVVTTLFLLGSFALALYGGHAADSVWAVGWLGVMMVVGFFLAIFKAGYGMWRRVDKETVTLFSFIFALLLAIDWYHLLPQHIPKAINDHLWIIFRGDGYDGHDAGSGYRHWWCLIAFFLFYKLISTCLRQLFDLNPPPSSPSQNSGSPSPSVPEFPQKSPLVQL